MTPRATAAQAQATRDQLVAATQACMLRQGYAATSVDAICAEAHLTKGSFFHHFPSKEAICAAALDAWGAMGTALYAEAARDPTADPLDQLRAFFAIMIGLSRRDEPCLCMVGMMSQELALTHPAIRAICSTHLERWTGFVVQLLRAALARHPDHRPCDPDAVGWLLNSIWQGSMLIAKTRADPGLLERNLLLAREYVLAHFPTHPASRATPRPRRTRAP